jgi:Fe-Mn family superoxide dismutase
MLKFLIALLIPVIGHAASRSDLGNLKAPYTLPALPYATAALAPVIDEPTMQLHHGKHHQAYVNNLNAALDDAGKAKNLLEILKATKDYPASVRNNAGGHWNHAFFWTVLGSESKKTKMSSRLRRDIEKTFGSFDKFKVEFEKQGLSVFGSGWVWLGISSVGKLQITTTPNQDNPLMDVAPVAGQPILALDVWEHAYYLAYQNKRADYVKNFWRIVDWNQVSKYYSEK